MAGPMGAGAPGQQSMDFKGSGKRLLAQFRPEKKVLWAMLATGLVSVALSVTGPKILGWATDLVFAGIVGRDM